MEKINFFKKINFNKPWNETDWERYFQAQDAYRVSVRNGEIHKKPLPKIEFDAGDEVEAFKPLLKAYGFDASPSIVNEIQMAPFAGDRDGDAEYTPFATEDPHFWGEGAPLASLPIYRDCCRLAITVSKEIDKLLKSRNDVYRNTYRSSFKNLRFHANWAAINVAEGHQWGYSKDRILGNVTKCRRAVKHLDQCIRLINKISQTTRSTHFRHDLFSFTAHLRRALYMWIDELLGKEFDLGSLSH